MKKLSLVSRKNPHVSHIYQTMKEQKAEAIFIL